DSWNDIVEVVKHIEIVVPGASLFAVGFSMGAGILLKHLGEEGPNARFKAAVAIAAPVDFLAVGNSLESSLKKRLMNFVMVSGVKLFMIHSFLKSPYADQLDVGKMWRARTLRQLEEASICKLHGYANSEDYYAQNSPRTVLPAIAVPTLIVNAEDDPVVSFKTLPVEDLKKNPRLYVAITKRGGHIGWGSGGLGAAAWTDAMAAHFMQACAPRSRL
ncbi:unnamed protein product, partial [Polarella glacialis]